LNSTLRSVLITSATPNEGKTTTAANLAVAMAEAGDRVVLVDCDLRRPALHKWFDLPNERGLTSLVIGDASLAETITFIDDNLAVVTSGPPVENPTEMLGSEEFARVLRAIVAQADFTIVDTPPVLPVADALIAGQHVDGVIGVCRMGRVRRRSVRELFNRLDEAAIIAVGLVANDSKDDSSYEEYGPGPVRTKARR
jgi:non-specific protein-tyrosine kinase